MMSFADFESPFLGSLQQERSDLQGLQGSAEAQLSGWIEHLFRQYLGYTHWKEINRGGGMTVGSKGGKKLFPDLRIDIADNGLIFIECKRPGRLDGPKGAEEIADGVSQLMTYIRTHVDQATVNQASVKPKMVLGVVTDGNRWIMLGLNKVNEFHTIAEWAFLTDDPRLLAQRMWLLAKSALAQPTSAVVEFLARRTLVEVLKDSTRSLTRKVNEKLPDGSVSEELIGRWLRDAFSDLNAPPRLAIAEAPPQPVATPALAQPAAEGGTTEEAETSTRRVTLSDLLTAGLLQQDDVLLVAGIDGRQQTGKLTADGRVDIAGTPFGSVSGAAVRALELAGRQRRTANGWAEFRVVRDGSDMGTLLEIRSQYEDREQGEGDGTPTPKGSDAAPAESQESASAVAVAMDHLKPLLGLLPELTPSAAKATISLYAGKLVVAYAYPRKRGLPRVRVFVGDVCPGWAAPDPTYAAWCYVDDWPTNVERVVALCKEAPRRRAEDLAAGRDPNRRRADSNTSEAPPAAETR
jgi:hypothetical protein